MLYDLIDKETYALPPTGPRSRRGRSLRILVVLALAAALGTLGLVLRRRRQASEETEPPQSAAPTESAAVRRVVYPFGRLTPPTPQTALLDGDPATVFMPTAAGRPESALYGSTRRAADGRPAFHEGIDIAPLRRDRRGHALDPIFAVADGRVAHISPHAGNSNYGIYIVLFHDDALGEIYTLYAHLAKVAEGLQTGQAVKAGAVLGRMGRTPARIVPVVRSHLHFETGLMLNRHFEKWLKARKIPSPHGIGHGWNLAGVDPRAVFAQQRRHGADFTMLAYLRSLPVAFEWVAAARNVPDFFRRYPALWQGEPVPADSALVLAFSAGGVPLRGRAATTEETRRLRGGTVTVLTVDEATLGGNGRRLIERAGHDWRPTSGGRRWLDIFLFEPSSTRPNQP
jgi:peptidoglycan LD-endopeptidase LytH